MRDTGQWTGGFAEWIDDDTAFLSVAFTWRLDHAYSRAAWYRQQGYKVRAGGPGIFTNWDYLAEVAELPRSPDGKRSEGDYPDAVRYHNPQATFASRGCPLNCSFCIVPKMQGRSFTYLPDFPVRPVLCDNNLSALPADYQRHIITRYKSADVPLLDANSGFEPQWFDEDCYVRWSEINLGPWRFGYDEQRDRDHALRVMRLLKSKGVAAKRIRPYVIIGNEPKASCLDRIYEVISEGGEPHVQPYIKLNAIVKRPWVRFDWTEQDLRDVARWANWRAWRKAPRFEDYNRSAHTERDRLRRPHGDDAGLFPRSDP
jgi:hypothetical protein